MYIYVIVKTHRKKKYRLLFKIITVKYFLQKCSLKNVSHIIVRDNIIFLIKK